MNLSILSVGKILVILPFVVFGSFHFLETEMMSMMVPAWLPGGVLWVYVIGTCIFAGVAGILLNKKARLACYCLAGLMGVFVVTIHIPGLGNESMRMMAMSGLIKDLGLAGGLLVLSTQVNP